MERRGRRRKGRADHTLASTYGRAGRGAEPPSAMGQTDIYDSARSNTAPLDVLRWGRNSRADSPFPSFEVGAGCLSARRMRTAAFAARGRYDPPSWRDGRGGNSGGVGVGREGRAHCPPPPSFSLPGPPSPLCRAIGGGSKWGSGCFVGVGVGVGFGEDARGGLRCNASGTVVFVSCRGCNKRTNAFPHGGTWPFPRRHARVCEPHVPAAEHPRLSRLPAARSGAAGSTEGWTGARSSS
jgi:hypothetical protein